MSTLIGRKHRLPPPLLPPRTIPERQMKNDVSHAPHLLLLDSRDAMFTLAWIVACSWGILVSHEADLVLCRTSKTFRDSSSEGHANM
ncbi:hypothetical protein IG631_05293 [Alternaria alternata]|nr:hypothetical protein IG631_05293 [Alternaria alternata]